MSLPGRFLTEPVVLTVLIAVACMSASYVTHVVWAVRLFKHSVSVNVLEAALAIGGCVFPPVGIVHGALILMGLA